MSEKSESKVFGKQEEKIWEYKTRVATICNLVWDKNLVTSRGGNISARLPGTDLVCIKPSGGRLDQVRPQDIIVVDVNANFIQGYGRPSSETPFHTAIYRARDDVGGVVHTHSSFATAFGISGVKILPILENGLNCKGFPIVPYAIGGSQELANNIIKGLGKDYVGIILQNHGVVGCGNSVEQAFDVAYYMEECARTQFVAMSIGKPCLLPQKDIDDLIARETAWSQRLKELGLGAFK